MDNLNNTIINFFSTGSLAGFFLKAFSIVFALLFLIYSIVTYKQIQEITRTVRNRRNRYILMISLLQILTGLVLLLFAILFV